MELWIELHRAELMADWELASQGEQPYKFGAVSWPHEQDTGPEILLVGMIPIAKFAEYHPELVSAC